MDKKWVVAAVASSAAIAASAAGQRLVGRWRRNPDPLNGQTVAFPDGDHRFVTPADGARLSTVTVGEGPTIVCVHGLTSSRHDWGPIAPVLLDAGYQLVAVEQRGHGDSTAGTAGYGSEQLGADLAHVMEVLDLRCVALMGHSMGGMAAMAYAVDQPVDFRDRVGSLVLIGTAASLVRRGSGLGFRLGGVPLPAVLKPAAKRLRVGAGLTVFGEDPSLHMIDEAISSVDNFPEEVRAEATAALRDHDLLREVGAIDRPTLVIGGTRDRLIWPSQVRALSAAIPGSELHMLEGAGHMLIWERWERIGELVLDLIGSVSPGVSRGSDPK